MEFFSSSRRKAAMFNDLGSLAEKMTTPVWVGFLLFGFCFLIELLGLVLIKMSIPS